MMCAVLNSGIPDCNRPADVSIDGCGAMPLRQDVGHIGLARRTGNYFA
jgi:hypothetical protein